MVLSTITVSFVSFRAIGLIWGIWELTAGPVVFAHFVIPPCPYPVGDQQRRHENHLHADCLGVGQIARGLRTWVFSTARKFMPVKRFLEDGRRFNAGNPGGAPEEACTYIHSGAPALANPPKPGVLRRSDRRPWCLYPHENITYPNFGGRTFTIVQAQK